MLFLVPQAKLKTVNGEVVQIQDGDTLTIKTGRDRLRKVRLADIDAPEMGQPFGKVARRLAVDLALEKTVRVDYTFKDKYDRLIGEVFLPDSKLLNEEISQLPLNQAFREADEILAGAIKCMSEITTGTGLVNIDYADLRSIMRSGGVAMIGTGEGSGPDRAADAVRAALTSPLLEVDIDGANGALVNVTGGSDMSLKEAETVLNEICSKINKEARIIWGASVDPELENSIRVMLVVTGVKNEQILGPPSSIEEDLKTRYGIDFVQ